MKKQTFAMLVWSMGFLFLTFISTTQATPLDVSVGTDDVIYKPGDNVTITGLVRSLTTGRPITGASVTITLTSPNGSTISTQSKTTDSDGRYTSDPVPLTSLGIYSISIQATKFSDTGFVTGQFKVEAEKRYLVTTDKYTYSLNDTVTITVSVQNVLPTGLSPASDVTLPVKIKLINGSVVNSTSITTNSNGTAVITYQIKEYGDYLVVLGNGLAMAAFEAPPFEVKVNVMGGDGKKKYLFSNEDLLKVRITTTITSSTGSSIPVKNANINVYLKDAKGNTVYTFNSSQEISDGVYETNPYSLSELSNGKYYVEAEITKSGSTRLEKVWFEIRSIRVDLVPLTEMKHITGFLKGQPVKLGLFVINMKTGEQISGEGVYNARIVGCKDIKGKDCMSKLSGELNHTEPGFMEFSKLLTFNAPNETGEFIIEVEVNTSAGLARGETSIFVQNIIAYTETKDQFDAWRWRYGTGENITLEVKAFTGSYTPIPVTRIEILEIRNESWDDITDSIVSASQRVSPGNRIYFTAPNSPGWYHVKLRINTSEGEGYTGTGFNVKLYDIWVDTMDGPYSNSSWKWRFGPNDEVYFHINVYNLGGHGDTNRVDSSEYTLSITKIRNELTHREYTNLNVSKYKEIPDDEWGRPVLRLSLSNLQLTSGPYIAEIELTDMNGNKDRGEAWFKVSNLDVWAYTKSETGEFRWKFEPTDNITFEVHAEYFNGTPVPDGSEVSIENLLYVQRGPPVPVPIDIYDKSNSSQTSGGVANVWIKAKAGKSLDQGYYMAIIKVRSNDSEQKEELHEVWFEVSVLEVYGWADPWYVSQSGNVSMKIVVKKVDGSPVNATLTLVELRDTMTWTEIDKSLYPYGYSKNTTGNEITVDFNFSVSNLPIGQYEAVVRVNAYDLGATSDAYVWFSVQNYQISGELVNPSKRVYAPEENVEMWITVKDPSGSALEGKNVSVYQLVNTESWPWTFKEAKMVGQASPTDAGGRTKVIFKAPKESGVYRPMVNVSGELQKDPWLLPEFEVRSIAVNVKLFDENGNEMEEFPAGSTIQVEVNISNPTGGEISVSQLSMKYRSMDTGTETQLQTITSNIQESNYLAFISPSSEGEYVLYVSVTDNVTGNIIVSKRWFRVKTFDLNFWTEKWAYDTGENITVYLDARNPDGSSINITVHLQALRDMWSGTSISGYSKNPVNISGTGIYNIITDNLQPGEYEAELCVYKQGTDPGTECENGRRIYIGFSIQSFEVHVFTEKGSFTPQDEVELFIVVELSSGALENPSNYVLSFIDLRDRKTWLNMSSAITSQITVENQTSPMNRKRITFTTSGLSAGEYIARFNVIHIPSGESRMREVWFKISDYEITIDTVPPVGEERRFFTGEPITFNITVTPAPNETVEGKVILEDDYRCIILQEYTINITPQGFALQNITIDTPGRYTLVAEVGSAEKFYWFEAGSYKIEIIHWDPNTVHDISPGEDVTIVFDILYPNGSEYQGDVTVTVVDIKNTWDWASTGVNNLNETNITATESYEQYSFTPNLGPGEYEAQLEFKTLADDKITTEYYHFNVRTKEFWAWPEGGPFSPGDNVTIKAVLRYPNGTAWSGINITIDEIYSQKEHRSIMDDVSFTTQYTDTDPSGIATLSFTLPANLTGKVDVKLREGDGNEITWTGFDINTYELRIDRMDDRWIYLPGENFTRRLYVFKSGSPQEGVDISVRVWKHGLWGPGQNVSYYYLGQTDSSGFKYINIPVPGEPARYEAEIIAGKDAATYWEGFEVAIFFADAWVIGENSNTDRLSEGENAIIAVYVNDPEGNKVAGANVSITEFRKIDGWIPVSVEVIKDNQTTDTTGRAELRFIAPNDTGEYVAIINVTANISGTVSSTERHAWFMVTQFGVSIGFVCPPDVSTCMPDTAIQGGSLTAKLSISGDTSNITNVNFCLDRVRNIFTGVETFYGVCNTTTTNTTYLTFTVPTERGSYDAIFKVDIQSDKGTESFEEWRWFEVKSEGEHYINAWMEPHDAWAGKNATVIIEVWSADWQDIDEESSCEKFELVEIRDTQSWSLEADRSSIQQWYLGAYEGPGPPGVRLVFTVPETLNPGEYEAKLNVTCSGISTEHRVHFRIVSFQVSFLMNEILQTNKNVQFWIKIMNASGDPVVGATVYKRQLIDEWSWQPVEIYPSSENYTTDSYGEVIGSFVTPSAPGNYLLQLEVEYNGTVQKAERWFMIKPMNVKIMLGNGKEKFFVNETVNVTVNVTDSMGVPVANASVTLNVWCMMIGPSSEDNETTTGCPEIPPMYNLTSPNGTATFILSNLTAGEYHASVDVNVPEMGSTWAEKPFLVRNFNITVNISKLEYKPGENITLFLTVRNQSGSPVMGEVRARLQTLQFKPTGDEEVPVVDEGYGFLSPDGNLSLNLTIPTNTTSGPALIFLQVIETPSNISDAEGYMILIHGPDSQIKVNITDTGPFQPGEFINATINASQDLMMAPFVRHLTKTGGAIPLFELFGGGPESGKDNWYGSSIYMNSTGQAHVMFLTQPQPGEYTLLIPFFYKSQQFFSDEPVDVAFVDYEVV